MTYSALYADPRGRTSRAEFIPALVVLLAAVAFYLFLVRGRTAQFCVLVLLYPALVLHARRLHDMGWSAWLLVAPAAPLLAAFGLWLGYIPTAAPLDRALPVAGLAISAAVALWCALARPLKENP